MTRRYLHTDARVDERLHGHEPLCSPANRSQDIRCVVLPSTELDCTSDVVLRVRLDLVILRSESDAVYLLESKLAWARLAPFLTFARRFLVLLSFSWQLRGLPPL